jgi:hypothetical protein
MLDEQAKSIMKSALLSTSKSMKVELKDLRIKMKLTDDLSGAECFAMNKTTLLTEVSWTNILGLKAIAFKRSIVAGITSRLHEIAEQNGIEKTEISARVYALDPSGTAGLYLYSGVKPLKQLDINDLI